jgi:hypothetical protein
MIVMTISQGFVFDRPASHCLWHVALHLCGSCEGLCHLGLCLGFELVGECSLDTILSKWLPRKAEEDGVRRLRVDSQKVGNCFNRTVWGIDGGNQYYTIECPRITVQVINSTKRMTQFKEPE